MRRRRCTKVLATLGPSSSTQERIRKLFDAGADAFRLNFSHGTHDQHAERYRNVRAVEEATGRPIAVVVDLQGPKLRVGRFRAGPDRAAGRRAVPARPGPGAGRRAPRLPAPSRDLSRRRAGHRASARRRPHPALRHRGRPGGDRDHGADRRRALATARASTCPTWSCRCRRSRPRIARICSSASISAPTGSRSASCSGPTTSPRRAA